MDINRTDKELIQTIEELGDEANGRCGNIVIVDVPNDIDYKIENYDGIESVHEKHRSWF